MYVLLSLYNWSSIRKKTRRKKQVEVKMNKQEITMDTETHFYMFKLVLLTLKANSQLQSYQPQPYCLDFRGDQLSLYLCHWVHLH